MAEQYIISRWEKDTQSQRHRVDGYVKEIAGRERTTYTRLEATRYTKDQAENLVRWVLPGFVTYRVEPVDAYVVCRNHNGSVREFLTGGQRTGSQLSLYTPPSRWACTTYDPAEAARLTYAEAQALLLQLADSSKCSIVHVLSIQQA